MSIQIPPCGHSSWLCSIKYCHVEYPPIRHAVKLNKPIRKGRGCQNCRDGMCKGDCQPELCGEWIGKHWLGQKKQEVKCTIHLPCWKHPYDHQKNMSRLKNAINKRSDYEKEFEKEIILNHFEKILNTIDALLLVVPDIGDRMEEIHKDFQKELVKSFDPGDETDARMFEAYSGEKAPRKKDGMQAMGNMLYHFGMILRSRKISRGKKLDVDHEK